MSYFHKICRPINRPFFYTRHLFWKRLNRHFYKSFIPSIFILFSFMFIYENMFISSYIITKFERGVKCFWVKTKTRNYARNRSSLFRKFNPYLQTRGSRSTFLQEIHSSTSRKRFACHLSTADSVASFFRESSSTQLC